MYILQVNDDKKDKMIQVKDIFLPAQELKKNIKFKFCHPFIVRGILY